ncbi:MAG: hypothetical protein H6625_04535 [Bdellovibrionaceae bacterium]|nr:hypothetical protein [Pseudobdellovibrionaceae bacterium]
MNLNIYAAIVLTLALGACSSDSGSGNSGEKRIPLTDQQKTNLKEFSQSVNDVGTAASKANNKSKSQTQIQSLVSVHNIRYQVAIAPRVPRSEKVGYIERSMDQCQFSNNLDDLLEPNQPANGDNLLSRFEDGVYFNVNGQDCPMDLKMNGQLSVNRQTGSISGGFSLELIVQDQNLVSISRIKSANFKATVSGQGSQSGSQMKADLKGQIDHLDKGVVTTHMEAQVVNSENRSRSTATITYVFADFSAIGDVASVVGADGKITNTYAINDESVSEQEFMEYFAGLAENKGSSNIGEGRKEGVTPVPIPINPTLDVGSFFQRIFR